MGALPLCCRGLHLPCPITANSHAPDQLPGAAPTSMAPPRPPGCCRNPSTASASSTLLTACGGHGITAIPGPTVLFLLNHCCRWCVWGGVGEGRWRVHTHVMPNTSTHPGPGAGREKAGCARGQARDPGRCSHARLHQGWLPARPLSCGTASPQALHSTSACPRPPTPSGSGCGAKEMESGGIESGSQECDTSTQCIVSCAHRSCPRLIRQWLYDNARTMCLCRRRCHSRAMQ